MMWHCLNNIDIPGVSIYYYLMHLWRIIVGVFMVYHYLVYLHGVTLWYIYAVYL